MSTLKTSFSKLKASKARSISQNEFLEFKTFLSSITTSALFRSKISDLKENAFGFVPLLSFNFSTKYCNDDCVSLGYCVKKNCTPSKPIDLKS